MKHGTIAIVFCGGCNPRIGRGKIASEIRTLLQADGYQVVINTVAADYVIYLSGCSANCALKYNCGKAPAAVVAAATVDAVAVERRELVSEVVAKVRDFYEQLENRMSD